MSFDADVTMSYFGEESSTSKLIESLNFYMNKKNLCAYLKGNMYNLQCVFPFIDSDLGY